MSNEVSKQIDQTLQLYNGLRILELVLKCHSSSEPIFAGKSLKPRQLGPLSHMEVEENDFGKTSTFQIGANTRADLLDRRTRLLIGSLDKAAKLLESKKERGMMEKIGFLTKSSKPWWKQGKYDEELAAIAQKQKGLENAFIKRSNKLTIKPTESQSGDSMIREKLNLKNKKGMVIGKITSHPGFDLIKHEVKRCTQKDRFTDVVIEFKLAGEQPPLDENGMSLEYNPQENIPLYSSFSEDQLFLEKEDRKLVTRLHREAELQKQKSRRLPRRMYVLDSGDRSSRPYTSPSQVMSPVNFPKQILDSRDVNSAPSFDQPKRVGLLTREGPRGNVPGVIKSDVGVRTGGFQCISYNQMN